MSEALEQCQGLTLASGTGVSCGISIDRKCEGRIIHCTGHLQVQDELACSRDGLTDFIHRRATSILASTEDARLEALRSLTAAVAVAYRGSAQPPAGLPLVSAAADALARALMPVLAHTARGQGDTAGVAFSWLSSSTAAAAEVSQVFVLA